MDRRGSRCYSIGGRVEAFSELRKVVGDGIADGEGLVGDVSRICCGGDERIEVDPAFAIWRAVVVAGVDRHKWFDGLPLCCG